MLTRFVNFFMCVLFFDPSYQSKSQESEPLFDLIKIHIMSVLFVLFSILRSELYSSAESFFLGTLFMLVYWTACLLCLVTPILFFKISNESDYPPDSSISLVWVVLIFFLMLYAFAEVEHLYLRDGIKENLSPDWLQSGSKFVRYNIFR